MNAGIGRGANLKYGQYLRISSPSITVAFCENCSQKRRQRRRRYERKTSESQAHGELDYAGAATA